jgi:hypothetical protein
MAFPGGLANALQPPNPAPDPDEATGADEAGEPAMRRPGSVIDWRIEDGDYVGDGYRIHLVEAHHWEITRRGARMAGEPTLTAAFSVVERHRRDALRRRDLATWAGVASSALVAGIAIGQLVTEGSVLWVLVAGAVLYAGVSAVVRFFAALAPNVANPYRRRMPWERRRRWRQRRRPTPPSPD